MKLSDYKNEEAIEVLADLLDPVSKIITDKEVESAMKAKLPVALIAKKALKKQKDAVIEMVAALHRSTPEEYEFTIPSLLRDLLDILNDPEVVGLFTLPDTEASSGSVTATTEAEKN